MHDMETTASRGRPRKIRPEVPTHSDAERIEHQRMLGDRLRKQRELRGWSPEELAMRAGLTGPAIRALERGERAPLTWSVFVLAKALDCGAGWLAFGG